MSDISKAQNLVRVCWMGANQFLGQGDVESAVRCLEAAQHVEGTEEAAMAALSLAKVHVKYTKEFEIAQQLLHTLVQTDKIDKNTRIEALLMLKQLLRASLKSSRDKTETAKRIVPVFDQLCSLVSATDTLYTTILLDAIESLSSLGLFSHALRFASEGQETGSEHLRILFTILKSHLLLLQGDESDAFALLESIEDDIPRDRPFLRYYFHLLHKQYNIRDDAPEEVLAEDCRSFHVQWLSTPAIQLYSRLSIIADQWLTIGAKRSIKELQYAIGDAPNQILEMPASTFSEQEAYYHGLLAQSLVDKASLEASRANMREAIATLDGAASFISALGHRKEFKGLRSRIRDLRQWIYSLSLKDSIDDFLAKLVLFSKIAPCKGELLEQHLIRDHKVTLDCLESAEGAHLTPYEAMIVELGEGYQLGMYCVHSTHFRSTKACVS